MLRRRILFKDVKIKYIYIICVLIHVHPSMLYEFIILKNIYVNILIGFVYDLLYVILIVLQTNHKGTTAQGF